MGNEQVLMAMTNVPDASSARTMARALVDARLAACVNILPGVQSVYRWQGAVEETGEFTLLVKTTRSHYPQLQQAILAAHPYDLPEVIAWPLTEGHPPYLHWVATETSPVSHD